LVERDFTLKTEKISSQKKGKRKYLNDAETKDFTKKMNNYFETNIEVPRIRVGKRQTIETLISEEALLLAKFLRNERREWHPRIVNL
jgi:CRISPR/Cas system-associated endonuclease Cas1